ncbi:AMP-binding protein [Streptomyces sp. NPDC050433]|uniref:AMP-binding protein n=1 Tax=Streptomyces sp. NPDC050433 TaxID=3365615 RepID=UPI0037B62AEF
MTPTPVPYTELPFDALWDSPGIGSTPAGAEPSDAPWHLPWDRLPAADAAAVRAGLESRSYVFRTSGSTAEPVSRILSGARLSADSTQLARLVDPYAPQAVVSFAPVRHAYGASATMLLPAVTGLPVWFWPTFDCPPPIVPAARIVVVAIPWTFRILRRHPRWLASFEHITFLHSSAELPPEARELYDGERTAVVEVLGSTETSAVAHRHGWDPSGPWTLFDDVTIASPTPDAGSNPPNTADGVPLTVSGPRLAALPDGSHPAFHELDDLIRPLDDRRFLRLGRRAHLVKVNGVRHDLNGIAARLRAALDCADVACVRVPDPLRGETYDVLIAGGTGLTEDAVRATARDLGAAPREIRLVDRVPRSSLGKPLAPRATS